MNCLRAAAALALLGACAPQDGPGRDRDRTTSPGTPTPTGSTTTPTDTGTHTTPPVVSLEQGTPVVCEDPSARDQARWTLRLGGILPAPPETWASGVVLGDFRGTGRLDSVVLGEDTNQYFYTEPSATAPGGLSFPNHADDNPDLASLTFSVGGAAADLNGDGYPDLIVTRWDKANRILMNDGAGGFVDETPSEMLIRTHKTQSVSLGDIDGDGDLDLFFGNYGDRPPALGDPNMPPGEPSELYRNDGNGEWTDMSANLPIEVHDGYTFQSSFHDLDGDLLPELLVWNDFSVQRPSQLGTNQGSFEFEFRDEWVGEAKMGVAVAELNGDGQPDYLMTSWNKNFLLQSGDALGLPGTWVDSTGAWGAAADVAGKNQVFGWGVDLGDLDNDGDVDGVAGYGYWLDWDELNAPGQIDAVYEQVAPQQFEDRAVAWGLDDAGPTRAVVMADLNRDGWLDLIKRQVGDWTLVRVANCGENHWLIVDLEAPAPNTDAVGATVRATVLGVTQTRWIQPGSTSLYVGSPPEAHFGLGDATAVDRLEVVWPDGHVSEFQDVAADQVVRVVRE